MLFSKKKGCERVASSLSQGLSGAQPVESWSMSRRTVRLVKGKKIVKWKKIAQYSLKTPSIL